MALGVCSCAHADLAKISDLNLTSYNKQDAFELIISLPQSLIQEVMRLPHTEHMLLRSAVNNSDGELNCQVAARNTQENILLRIIGDREDVIHKSAKQQHCLLSQSDKRPASKLLSPKSDNPSLNSEYKSSDRAHSFCDSEYPAHDSENPTHHIGSVSPDSEYPVGDNEFPSHNSEYPPPADEFSSGDSEHLPCNGEDKSMVKDLKESLPTAPQDSDNHGQRCSESEDAHSLQESPEDIVVASRSEVKDTNCFETNKNSSSETESQLVRRSLRKRKKVSEKSQPVTGKQLKKANKSQPTDVINGRSVRSKAHVTESPLEKEDDQINSLDLSVTKQSSEDTVVDNNSVNDGTSGETDMQAKVKCEICKALFSQKGGLASHVRWVHRVTWADYVTGLKMSQEDSASYFSRIINVKNIEKVSEKEKSVELNRSLKCPICNLSLGKSKLLYKHIRTVHKAAQEKEGFWQELEDLEAENAPKNFGLSVKCPYCNKVRHGIPSIKRHIKVWHSSVDGWLSKSEETVADMQTRMKNGPLYCPYCNEECGGRFNLAYHIRSLCDKNPAKVTWHHCPKCASKFTSNERLKSHLELRHTAGDKEYTCEICGKSYVGASGLLSHKRSIHDIADKVPIQRHECPVCKKVFTVKHRYKIHILSHSDEKTAQCDICGKRFKADYTLRKHKARMHTHNYPFKCDTCGHGVIKKQHLSRHKCSTRMPVTEAHNDAAVTKNELMTDAMPAVTSSRVAATGDSVLKQLMTSPPDEESVSKHPQEGFPLKPPLLTSSGEINPDMQPDLNKAFSYLQNPAAQTGIAFSYEGLVSNPLNQLPLNVPHQTAQQVIESRLGQDYNLLTPSSSSNSGYRPFTVIDSSQNQQNFAQTCPAIMSSVSVSNTSIIPLSSSSSSLGIGSFSLQTSESFEHIKDFLKNTKPDTGLHSDNMVMDSNQNGAFNNSVTPNYWQGSSETQNMPTQSQLVEVISPPSILSQGASFLDGGSRAYSDFSATFQNVVKRNFPPEKNQSQSEDLEVETQRKIDNMEHNPNKP